MGNQGMTNWKFSAFLAITLMLVAGLFSTTAMAASGDGIMTVDQAETVRLTANSTVTLEFTYTVTIENEEGETTPAARDLMNGGLLQLDIPNDWKFSAVAGSEGTVSVTGAGTGGGLISGTTDDPVLVQLGSDFGDDADTYTLTISVANIIVPIPPRLTDGTEADRYEQYEFTASSRSRVGKLDTLNPTTDEPEPQAFVRVGNIASGEGTVTVSPDEIYETYTTEKPRKITIDFEATGPMWNSSMVVTLPASLDPVDPDAKSGESGYLRVGNRGGSDIKYTADADNTVEITIDAMDKGQGVEIIYYSDVPGVVNTPAETASAFGVTTDTGAGTQEAVTVETGKLRRKDGSGTMMVGPMYVEIADENDDGSNGPDLQNFTLTYEAKTNLEHATLTIIIPQELTGVLDSEDSPEDADTEIESSVDDTDGDQSTDLINIARGVAGTGDDKRNRSTAGYVYAIDRHAAPADLEVTNGNTIVWHDLTINAGQKFRTVIRVDISQTVDRTAGAGFGTINDETDDAFDDVDDGMYPFDTSVDTPGDAGETDVVAANDAALYAVKGDNESVTFELIDPADEDSEPFAADEDIQFHAASVQTLTFRFTADTTTIKGGTVSIRMPSGWSPTPTLPNDDDDNPGRTKATIDNDAERASGVPVALDEKKISAGRTTTITVDALREDGAIDITFHDITVQRSADTVDFIGEFKTQSGARSRRAGRIEVEVLNVEDGSGNATIATATTPRYSVKAGSVDNKITVVFTADGTMDGGQVTLERPADWGDMQDNDAAEPNHVTVAASGSGASITSNVGRDLAVANISSLGYNGKITFTINDAEASSDLGIDEFVIKSKGSAESDAELMPLAGEQQGDDDGPEDLLTGKVYWIDENDDDKFTRGTDTANGILRIAVAGAADGTGDATVEIRGSDHEGKYGIDDEGEVDADAVTRQVHAGSTGSYLLFTYSPSQTIEDGELRFTVDPDWSPPQDEEQGEVGYTFLDEVGQASIGTPVFSGDSITVEIIEVTKQDAIQIHYGWHGTGEGNAVAPTSVEMSRFGIQIKGSESGSLKSIRTPPTVEVREQASGEGTPTIAPATATAGGTATVTITYEAEGEIEDGSLKLTVPDKWSGAARENFTIRGGGGSARYDGDYDTDNPKPDAADVTYDIPGAREVIYSGISLSAGGMVTFTFTTDVIGTVGSQTFNIAFKGGDGPDDDFKALSDLTVTVNEAGPGDGDVAVRGADGITAGSTGNEISFVYVATGAVDYPGVFAVGVPETWDEDGPAASDYTVTYEDADGDLLTGTQESVEEVAPEDQNMQAQIKGANSPVITAGHQVVFTYTSDAPATPGAYDFTVFYDEVEVDTITVNILSAEDASAIELASSAALDGTDTPVAITISLVDANGVAATRSAALSVALSSDVATGMFSDAADGTYAATLTVLISVGQTEMTVYYQDASGDAATVTASSDLPDATVDIETDVDKVYPGSVSVAITDSDGVEKGAAALGDTVTVTAMANGAPTFAVGAIATSVSMSATATAGTYSGTWSPVSDLHDGMHAVTVTLGDSSVPAADQLTVDTKDPVVAVTAPAAGMTVQNEQAITISATVTDDTAVTVTADVSALDSGAEADSVTLTAGTGTHTISEANTNANGEYTITVTATDAAGNTGSGTVAVMLDNTRSFTSMIPDGVSLFSVPLEVEGLDTVADLKAALGDSVLQVIAHRGGADYDADSDDVAITGDRGLILVTNGAVEHEFVGRAWGGGTATISVDPAANTLIGVPVDTGDMMVSDLMALFPEGVAQAVVIAAGDNEYPRVDGADDPDDAAVTGDAAYLVIGASAGEAMVSGAGWSNGTASAAPIALSGYQLDTQTPLVSVYGSVVDEITGLAKEGFRVKVKNLTTKAALSEITSVEAADGYNMTFVDLTDAHAARVGDVLEISADSPDPLVGVQPVRHIVTVDDVKNSRITLEDLIAYEIPAETELLRNYPNPFNPETWIPYRLAEDADVSLTIYDVNGELVRDIDVGHQSAAVYETRAKAIYWDGRNRFGEQVASGIYFYHLSAGDDFSATRKMVILK